MTDQPSPFTEWYEIRDQLVPFIGERALSLFAHAVFTECDGTVGAAWFSRALVESGNDLDDPQVTETERLLIDWGRLVARDPGQLADRWRAQFAATFSPALQQLLVRFAALSVATALVERVGTSASATSASESTSTA